MAEPNVEFNRWCGRWTELASFTGPRLPDVDARIEASLALWNDPLLPDWNRGRDEQLLDRHVRYRRGNTTGKRAEHAIEEEFLSPSLVDSPVTSLGFRVIDGVNAVPLTRDAWGTQTGNVEADMLLLVSGEREHRLHLVEVKDNANDAWYAAVENLRQLRLLTESESTQRLFHACCEIDLPADLPVTAVVLAPRTFYESRGKKVNSVAPAQRLLGRMRAECGVDAALAKWDRVSRLIEPL